MLQQDHEILPNATQREAGREDFCASLRKFFTSRLWPGATELYREVQAPAFRRRNGRDPNSEREVEALMAETYYYRATSLIGRAAQELLWDTVGESVERQCVQLNALAKPRNTDVGSVRLNPDLAIPRYIQAVDIHTMPGNFHSQRCPGDVSQGALYDRGVFVFTYGGLGELNQDMGTAVARLVKARFPDLKPRRILDLGCGVGFSTLPFKEEFPDAEVHGVDIGAPMVAYAHRRAESLGVEVHFSQQNMERTDFPDGYFDLVVSVLVTHECPTPVNKAMFAEAYRLLAPGGVMMHDGKTSQSPEPVMRVMSAWFTHNINEPFTAQMQKLDYRTDFQAVGFEPDAFFETSVPPVYLKGHLSGPSFVGAVKQPQTHSHEISQKAAK